MSIKISPLNSQSPYTLIIKPGTIKGIGKVIKHSKTTGALVILTNNKIKRLWFDALKQSLKNSGIDYRLIIIPDGERYKSIDMYKYIISKLAEYKVDRYGTLLTFGGGVIGDLGGFAAATYKRGMDLIHVPTTLVAQIDSSIGGKTGINLAEGKNLLGTFYNPGCVCIDPNILSTLDDTQFRNGLFEAIKISLVRNPKLFSYIQKNCTGILKRQTKVINKLVYRCAFEKAKIVEEDPFEKSTRMILNFGHTFGHALETGGKYRKLGHGEAVGWGMLLAFNLSEMLNLSDNGRFNIPRELIYDLLGKRRLSKANPDDLWRTMSLDKKVKNNKVRFVLLRDIGQTIIKEVNKNQFQEALAELCRSERY
jgi:3-dehydroquinate synthase